MFSIRRQNSPRNLSYIDEEKLFNKMTPEEASLISGGRIVLLPGIDVPGSDYKSLVNQTISTCVVVCNAEPDCKSFTYVPKSKRPGGPFCFLKNRIPAGKKFLGLTSGIKTYP